MKSCRLLYGMTKRSVDILNMITRSSAKKQMT